MPKQTNKQSVEQHLRSELSKAREREVSAHTHIKQLQERNDNQCAQLQNKLNREIELERETSRRIHSERQAHHQTKFQLEMTVREITRLLLLEQFSGGKENELMLTRSRNRLLDALVPTQSGECQEVTIGGETERRPTEEELEKTQS